MDIERSEYKVINSISAELLKRFRILIVEFHMLINLMKREAHQEIYSAFEKILEHFYCVHIHPNNCCGAVTIRDIEFPVVAEFTFYRKDRMKPGKKVTELPHKFDRDNREKPTLVLPYNWYQREPN